MISRPPKRRPFPALQLPMPTEPNLWLHQYTRPRRSRNPLTQRSQNAIARRPGHPLDPVLDHLYLPAERQHFNLKFGLIAMAGYAFRLLTSRCISVGWIDVAFEKDCESARRCSGLNLLDKFSNIHVVVVQIKAARLNKAQNAQKVLPHPPDDLIQLGFHSRLLNWAVHQCQLWIDL